MKHLLSIILFLFLISLGLGGQSAFGQDDVEALREEIAEQKKQLNEQMRNIEALERKLDDVESKEAREAGKPDGKANTQKGSQIAEPTGSDKSPMASASEISGLRDTVF